MGKNHFTYPKHIDIRQDDPITACLLLSLALPFAAFSMFIGLGRIDKTNTTRE